MISYRLSCSRRESMLLGAILITGVLISSAASQGKAVTAQTGEAELIETGGTGTNFAMTEEDYSALMKQLAGSPVFVPMTKKPKDLSLQARFGVNFVLGGLNRAWILDGDDVHGYVLYADINANGDLGDDPPHRFNVINGRYSLRLQLTAKSKDGEETYPVTMMIVIDRVAPPGKADKQLALLMYGRTRRHGQFFLESGDKPLPFVITGSSGTYGGPYDWIYFDMDRDGTFDPDLEGYQISERYVNIGDVTYEFAVDPYGRSAALTPLAEKKPARAILLAGYLAPEFSFIDLQGANRRLSDYRGKIVLLDFWGTWCGPCVASVPGLVAAYERYHARGFEIIGIAAGDDREKLLAFTTERRMSWPQVTESDNGPIASLYRITGWPSYFLIGADGRLLVAAPGGEKIDIPGELAKLFPERGPL